MTFLLDTNAFSDLMRNHPRLDARLAQLPSTDRVVICTISRGEILYGIRRLPSGARKDALEQKALVLFAAIPCLVIPESAADRYADIKSDCQRRGLAVDENDLWISATALAVGAVVISRDSDLLRISGLGVQDWTT